jgi:hypothetical protein
VDVDSAQIIHSLAVDLEDVDVVSLYTQDVSFLRNVQTDSGPTQSPIQRVQGIVSPGVKRQRREAEHSPPFSAEVKNGGAIRSLPLRVHGVVLN